MSIKTHYETAELRQDLASALRQAHYGSEHGPITVRVSKYGRPFVAIISAERAALLEQVEALLRKPLTDITLGDMAQLAGTSAKGKVALDKSAIGHSPRAAAKRTHTTS